MNNQRAINVTRASLVRKAKRDIANDVILNDYKILQPHYLSVEITPLGLTDEPNILVFEATGLKWFLKEIARLYLTTPRYIVRLYSIDAGRKTEVSL